MGTRGTRELLMSLLVEALVLLSKTYKPLFTPLYAQLSEVRGTMSARAFSLGKQLIRATIALFPSYCRPVRVEPIHGFFRQSLSIATQRQ